MEFEHHNGNLESFSFWAISGSKKRITHLGTNKLLLVIPKRNSTLSVVSAAVELYFFICGSFSGQKSFIHLGTARLFF